MYWVFITHEFCTNSTTKRDHYHVWLYCADEVAHTFCGCHGNFIVYNLQGNCIEYDEV